MTPIEPPIHWQKMDTPVLSQPWINERFWPIWIAELNIWEVRDFNTNATLDRFDMMDMMDGKVMAMVNKLNQADGQA